MGSKVRGVGYLVGAARRLYYLVHSHRRDDHNPGNTRGVRNRLATRPERDDGQLQNRGYRRRTILTQHLMEHSIDNDRSQISTTVFFSNVVDSAEYTEWH
jgi:hypothetical protein